jgi:hypothetical protein
VTSAQAGSSFSSITSKILPQLSLILQKKHKNDIILDQKQFRIRLEPELDLLLFKGGFFSESAMKFFQISKSQKKNIPKSYPELEI